MSAQSLLNKVVFAIFVLAVCQPCAARDYIDQLRSTESVHGLYEVREAARKFVTDENARNNTHWKVLEPNLKAQVAKCAVPLSAKWAPKSARMSGKNVLIFCLRTVQKSKSEEQWTLAVPVIRHKSAI